jgi:hypothetical protein
MRIALVCTSAVLVVCAVQAEEAPGPDLREALTTYIDRFVETSTNVVADEQYTQEAGHPRRRRVLRSEFAVVRYPGSPIYVFRDAFEVDGRRVRDPEEVRFADALRRAGARGAAAGAGAVERHAATLHP